MGLADALVQRVVIDDIRPQIDAGRFPIKRTAGEAVDVCAVIIADGHDEIAAVLRDRPIPAAPPAGTTPGGGGQWRETEMRPGPKGSDQFLAAFEVAGPGWHEYAIHAWIDRFRTWRRDTAVKAAAGQDVSVELVEGAALVREAAARAEQVGSEGAAARFLHRQADALCGTAAPEDRVQLSLDEELGQLMFVYAARAHYSSSRVLRVWVDRERARFGAWYEMFPRSAGPDPARSATFREAAGRLRAIADLGFDVVYLPPIHPIGRSFRKGRNNTTAAQADDPGSPWAIGSAEGGHTAVHPELGTLDDFLAFRREAERLGLEVALDLAWQCSPDHPWVREHPTWFRHRPDGTIKYAENPPKKYQDIYPLDFASADWKALWRALLDVTRFWIDQGVRIFRVDNPHTKTFNFWEWMIGEVQARDPDVIFLAEAFTRPKPMRYLAKAGFTQSYSYFTWRNTREELEAFFTDLTGTEVREYLRANLFTNTPDILHEYLQKGGRPAFQARLLLASTLGASYGIYSGFELCEARAVPGSEEYLDSEKYQIRQWDWDRPGHIKELVARVNHVRRRCPPLQYDWPLTFHESENPQIIAYSKGAPAPDPVELDGGTPPRVDGAVFVVVNLDPKNMQHGHVRVPAALLASLGIAPDAPYSARDLIDDIDYRWQGEWNYVRFDPDVRQGHILWLSTPRT